MFGICLCFNDFLFLFGFCPQLVLLGNLFLFDRRVELLGEVKVDDIELVDENAVFLHLFRQCGTDFLAYGGTLGNQFFRGILGGNGFHGFLNCRLEHGVCIALADALIDLGGIVLVDVVVDRHAAGNGLQILGNTVGIDLGLLDLVVHHHDLLGKGHFQMHALAQYPIRNLSHGDDHAGVSRRNDGHSRCAGDQSQKHYRTNEDPVPQFVVFHRHSFPEQLKCSLFFGCFLNYSIISLFLSRYARSGATEINFHDSLP